MRNLVLFLCSALVALAADDPWAKLKELKTGTELRVYKKGAAQPLLVKMDELTDDNLVAINKNEQTAIARDQIDRVDYRPSGKSRVMTETTTKVNDGVGDPKAVIPSPRQQGNPGPSTSTSSNVSIGSKPDFETIYRRPTGGPKK
ncbi:MAG: hypothetical protein NTW28_33635 [Candidatus Solibacter sp.]|nr:hypothetical protein [Candidatus Solibacter sp.]